jgi:hypothetical protein
LRVALPKWSVFSEDALSAKEDETWVKWSPSGEISPAWGSSDCYKRSVRREHPTNLAKPPATQARNHQQGFIDAPIDHHTLMFARLVTQITGKKIAARLRL